MAWDHDHVTDRLRGWVCYRCNIGLAYIEREGWLELALTYLANPPRDGSYAEYKRLYHRQAGRAWRANNVEQHRENERRRRLATPITCRQCGGDKPRGMGKQFCGESCRTIAYKAAQQRKAAKRRKAP